MATVRVEVSQHVRELDPPRDFVDNVLHFTTEQPVVTAICQDLADKVSAIWKLDAPAPSWGAFAKRGHTIKVFNLADIKPRPIIAQATYTPTFWNVGDMLPRQLAIALSFYADRNIPRHRGRIYVGPWGTEYGGKERIGDSTMLAVLDLGRKLWNLATTTTGGFTHAIFSPTLNAADEVAHYWVNDVWDTQRRRTPKESSRERYNP